MKVLKLSVRESSWQYRKSVTIYNRSSRSSDKREKCLW